MEITRPPFVVLATATCESRRVRDTVLLLPGEPLMYFNPYFTTSNNELDLNQVRYYKTQKEFYEQQKIDPHTIRNEIIMDDVQRHANTNVMRVMELPGGDIQPAYVPLLSDIHGYLQHRGVTTFVKWFYSQHQFEEGEVVPKNLLPIFNPIPTFDAASALTFDFPLRERHIFIGAKTNSIHVMKILARMSSIELKAASGITKKTGIHYHRLSLCGNMPEDDSPVFHEGSFVLCWNATDVLRPSFVEKFRKLYDCYRPMLFIITEARPKHLQVWELIPRLPGRYQYASSGHGPVGGVLLLWNKEAEPLIKYTSNCLTRDVMNVEVVPGPLIDPPPPLHEAFVAEDDDDYNYTRRWWIDSGMELIPPTMMKVGPDFLIRESNPIIPADLEINFNMYCP